MSHTKGPWLGVFAQGYAAGDDGNCGGMIFIDRARKRPVQANKDDYRLMAAAPELLEALKHVDRLLNEGVLVRDISRDGDLDFIFDVMSLVQDLNKIKIAIAKAEGRSDG